MASMTAITVRRIMGCPFFPVSNELYRSRMNRLEMTTFAGANGFRHACFGGAPPQPCQHTDPDRLVESPSSHLGAAGAAGAMGRGAAPVVAGGGIVADRVAGLKYWKSGASMS
jgi:hypothetical protein